MSRTEHGSPLDDAFQGESNKHEAARALAEAGLQAEQQGDFAKADHLFDQAERTDPDALANVLESAPPLLVRRPGKPASDAEVAAMTRGTGPGIAYVPPDVLDEQ